MFLKGHRYLFILSGPHYRTEIGVLSQASVSVSVGGRAVDKGTVMGIYL